MESNIKSILIVLLAGACCFATAQTAPAKSDQNSPESRPPALRIRDFTVQTILDPQFQNALLKINLRLGNPFPGKALATVEALLLDSAGKKSVPPFRKTVTVEGNGDASLEMVAPVRYVHLWSAEYPNLYQLRLALRDSAGKSGEVISADIGFRKVEIKEDNLQVNGRLVPIHAVKDPEMGSGQSRVFESSSIIAGLKLMKQNNFNAVWTDGNANQPAWSDLCDKYGIYLLDDGEVERIKNRPSIIYTHNRLPARFTWDWADLTLPPPQRRLAPVKKEQQYTLVKAVDLKRRIIDLKNEYGFTNLKKIATGVWCLQADGQVIQRGTLPELDLPPRAAKAFTIPVKAFTPEPGVEYWLDLSFTLKKNQWWAKAGFEVAWEQFKLPDFAPLRTPNLEKAPALQMTETNEDITLAGTNFSTVFDRNRGWLKSYLYQGVELIKKPLCPDFGLTSTDTIGKVSVEKTKTQAIKIIFNAILPSIPAEYQVTYTVYGSGDIIVALYYKPQASRPVTDLAKFGMQMALPAGFDSIAWYGRGPLEKNNDPPDTRVGIYRGTADGPFFNTEARWTAFTNNQGLGLFAVGQPFLNVNSGETVNPDFRTVNLDSSEKSRIKPGVKSYRFRLRGIAPADGTPIKLSKLALPKDG